MRAQVLLLEGPYDQEIVGVGTTDGEWPTELRAASGRFRGTDGKIECAAYVKVEVSDDGPIKFGHYRFVGNKLSAQTLIKLWM